MIDREEAPPCEAATTAVATVPCPTSSVVVLGYN